MMTEEESRKALFELNKEYMNHTAKERVELYQQYQEKRGIIRKALINAMIQKKLEETKQK